MNAMMHRALMPAAPRTAQPGYRSKACSSTPAVHSHRQQPRFSAASTQRHTQTYGDNDDQQVPGVAMPGMQLLRQQMQQPQQQLHQQQHVMQQQRTTAAAAPQESSVRPQRHQLQQLQERPVLLPRPYGTNLDSNSSSKASAVLDAPGLSTLRQAIGSSNSIHQLLQLLPDAAAANQADITTRLLLQAVAVVRATSSSSSSNASTGSSSSTDGAAGKQQQQQQELRQLLCSCDALLLQQVSRLAFQHVSGILWSWAQLRWKPAAVQQAVHHAVQSGTVQAAVKPAVQQQQQQQQQGSLWRLVINQLVNCEVRRELSGSVPSAGSQLARCTTAAATLNIQNPKVWAKLYLMIQALASTLNPSEVARCAWGLARIRLAPRANKYPAMGALLVRAQQCLGLRVETHGPGFSDRGAPQGLGFSAVAALNVLWAVADLDSVHLAPAGVLAGLVARALGPEYQAWYLQQEQQEEREKGYVVVSSDNSNSSSSAACPLPAAAAAVKPPECSLSPTELASLVWSCARMARDDNRRLQAAQRKQQLGQQQLSSRNSSSSSGVGVGVSNAWSGVGVSRDIVDLQQQQQWQQQQEEVFEDLLLLSYLAAATRAQLKTLRPRQIATLARGFVTLGYPDTQLVAELWQRALQVPPEGMLAGFNLLEVHLLLMSVADLQQQRQQHCDAAAAAQVVIAAVQRVLTAEGQELQQPRTAAALLQVLVKVAAFRGASRAGTAAGWTVAAAAADSSAPLLSVEVRLDVAVRLLRAVRSAGFSRLQNQQLVVLAAAAGQLAAAAAAGDDSFPGSSSSNACTAVQQEVEQTLQQLSLPLAAIAQELKLQHLATVLGGYAAAGVRSEQLFDAASHAVQKRDILDHGSSWALARLLTAYATVSHTDERLFAAVADVLVTRLGLMHARVLARFSWALATAGYHDMDIFRAIGHHLVSQQQQQQGLGADSQSNDPSDGQNDKKNDIWSFMQPRDLAAVAWSFGAVGLKDAKPYYALADRSVHLLQGFTFSQISSLIWGLAAAGVYHEGIVKAVTLAVSVSAQQQQQQRQMLPALLQGASAQDVATLAWSLAGMRAMTPGVLQSCTAHFMQYSRQYNPSDAADLAWAVLWSGDWAVQAVHLRSHERAALQSEVRLAAAEGAVQKPGCIAVLLHELLATAAADLEQLSPQQLVNLGLVVAVASAAADDADADAGATKETPHTASFPPPPAAATQTPGRPGLIASVLLQQQQQLLWSAIADWGPGAFTAADGVKLLWAQLVEAQQQQRQQSTQATQQQQQQQRATDAQQQQAQDAQTAVQQPRRRTRIKRDGMQGAAAATADAVAGAAAASSGGARLQDAKAVAVKSKLLAAGARAAVHHTAAICSSPFSKQVLATLHSLGLPAALTVQPGKAAAAAAAAAAATAGHASIAAPTSAAAGGGGGVTVWDMLAAAAAMKQLLGHIVVDVGAVNAAASDNQGSQVAAAAGCTAIQQQQQQQQVLLVLVPDHQLSRTGRNACSNCDSNSSSSSSSSSSSESAATALEGVACSTSSKLQQQQQRLTGLAAISGAVLLPGLQVSAAGTLKAVVVTEPMWRAWGMTGEEGRQADTLKQLLLQ